MIIDQLRTKIQIKIVYFGPALSGKTTTIKALFNYFGKNNEIFSIDSTVGRTLFFDYGIIKFRKKPWLLNVHLYTCTGQDFYSVTRPITLEAVDGVIFVADSQISAFERNIISWKELNAYFNNCLIDLPKVIAFNKQDLKLKFPIFNFLKEIKYENYNNITSRLTIALSGEGVLNSFEDILSLIFKDTFNTELISETA